MNTLLLAVAVLLILVSLKVWVFSSEEEKCFRRIWSMNKMGVFQEESETYDRLFKKFNIEFERDVSNVNLIQIIGAAHKFDAEKSKRNLGVLVGPIVEKEVQKRMSLSGKGSQFENLQVEMQNAGKAMLEAAFRETE